MEDAMLNEVVIDERTVLAGQPTEAQLRALRGQGFEAVVNLAPATTAPDGTPIDEAAILAAEGLAYHHIPVPWTAPDTTHFERFAALLDGLGERRTLIHCALNFRVTAFYGSYAMRRHGWNAEQADALIARVWQTRPEYPLGEAWQAFIRDTRPSATAKEGKE